MTYKVFKAAAISLALVLPAGAAYAFPATLPSATLALGETGGDIVLAGHRHSHKWNRYHGNRHYGWNGHRRHHGYSSYHRRHYGSGFSFGLAPYPYYGGYGYGYGPSFGIYIR